MKCPNCSVDLTIGERKNIEIDFCPKCRGIWLDRGELDKIIELSDSFEANMSNKEPQKFSKRENDDDNSDFDGRQHRKNRRRESFLGDLFDF